MPNRRANKNHVREIILTPYTYKIHPYGSLLLHDFIYGVWVLRMYFRHIRHCNNKRQVTLSHTHLVGHWYSPMYIRGYPLLVVTKMQTITHTGYGSKHVLQFNGAAYLMMLRGHTLQTKLCCNLLNVSRLFRCIFIIHFGAFILILYWTVFFCIIWIV